MTKWTAFKLGAASTFIVANAIRYGIAWYDECQARRFLELSAWARSAVVRGQFDDS